MSEGPKETAGKLDWSVFPFTEAEHVCKVFEGGAVKYKAPFTYRQGIDMSKLFAACMRHLVAIQRGERVDPESGQLHASHIAANGLMMVSQSICDGDL